MTNFYLWGKRFLSSYDSSMTAIDQNIKQEKVYLRWIYYIEDIDKAKFYLPDQILLICK